MPKRRRSPSGDRQDELKKLKRQLKNMQEKLRKFETSESSSTEDSGTELLLFYGVNNKSNEIVRLH